MAVPSIKGILIQHPVERIQGYLDEGRVSRRELEIQLGKEELAFFDGEKVVPGLWYPAAMTHRLLQLIYDVEGRDEAALRELGRETAGRLLQAPAFQSLFEAAARRGDASAGPLVLKLAEVVLNFSKWRFDGELHDFRVEVTEAEALSDYSRHTMVGLMETVGSAVAGRAVHVTSERPTPARMVFRGKAAPPA